MLFLDFLENHYLKHHPMYEFRNFEELHVDGYLHWLHGRADYFNSETYQKESPWEMGSKFGHLIYCVGLPIFYFIVLINNYVSCSRISLYYLSLFIQSKSINEPPNICLLNFYRKSTASKRT